MTRNPDDTRGAPIPRFRAGGWLATTFAILSSAVVRAQTDLPVAITETGEALTLSNGIVTAVVSKRTGDLQSFSYKGTETLDRQSAGHPGAYWSHDTAGGKETVSRVSIDPASNGGGRGEVSVKGISGGIRMGHGPDAPPEGNLPLDIDIRYAMERGDSGVFTYTIFDHRPEYGSGVMVEARFAAKLGKWFDHLHVDAERSGKYPLLNEGIDKYVYTTLQWEERAFGWTSPDRKLGWFMINPSAEYLSGGPTKAEFLAHGTAPTVLNYWKSSHYGGANVSVTEGGEWKKVIGPFLLCVNEGATPDAMWADAKARLARESARWPYDWVAGGDYRHRGERKDVSGRFLLDDPVLGNRFPGKITVGLAKAPYEAETPFGRRTITWDTDGRHYQFWSRQADLGVSINGKALPALTLGRPDGALTRHQIYGKWYELALPFDGGLLREGENELTLTVPAGSFNAGVVYDFLRLELDDGRPSTVQAEAPKTLQMPKATREGAPPANYDEANVRTYTLPDPLVMADGQPVRTKEDWVERRRPEIMKLLAGHQFGITPERKIAPTVEVVESGVSALGGKARRTQARLRFGADGPLIHVLVNLPANAGGKVPVMVHLGFSPNVLTVVDDGIDEGTGWDPARKTSVPGREGRKVGEFDPRPYLDAGIGVVNVYCGDIDPDFHGGTQSGVRSLFGTTDERKPDEWGAMGGWAWGLSRVLDFLETAPDIDAGKVALSGVSRLGKAVLWAGAQDQRFALLLPVVSGEGGAALSRRNFGETIADLMNPNRYDYWFAPRYDDYSFAVDKLPVDGHFLIAMAAPRPIMLVTGSLDGWSDPRGEWLAAQAAAPVFRLLGKSGPGDGPMPAPETPVQTDLGWFMHAGPHGILPSDHAAMIAFMKKHFGMP